MNFVDILGPLITLVVGSFAIYLYIKQKRDQKKDAALLILQEIRYAEQKIRDYKSFGTYEFSDRLLPTINWNKNINLFIKDLSESELDLISRFYAQAAYIDTLIKHLSDMASQQFEPITEAIPAQVNFEEQLANPAPRIQLQRIPINPRAKILIEEVSRKVEPIYNSPAIDKLNKLSKRHWYRFGL